MRVKHCAARQIEELPFEQVAGATSKRDAVVEFQGPDRSHTLYMYTVK